MGTKIKDVTGAIIGVADVHVTCPKCKGEPFLHGTNKGKPQPKSRVISIKTKLPAAKALFEIHGAKLFSDAGDEEEGEGWRGALKETTMFRSK